jgi:transcriptional regulator GlxA family with amidase domain
MRAGGTDPLASAAASAAMLELLLWVAMQAAVAQRSSSALAATRGLAAAERDAAKMHERLEEPLSIPDLAAEVDLTQNYLARIFRVRYGMTMPRFLLTCRMDHAKHLLAHTAIPVSNVAARAGMPDVQHFNKQFRKLVGISPSAYRSRNAR